MAKTIAREFIWLIAALLLAIPLAFIFLIVMDIVSAQSSGFSEEEKIFILDLFVLAYLFSFLGIYLFRFVVMAIKTLAAPEEA